MRLVLFVHLGPEGLFGLVEDNREMGRSLVRFHFLEQLPQHVAEAVDRVHMRAVRRPWLESDRVIGAENVAGAVDEKDVIALFHRPPGGRRGFCGRDFDRLGWFRFCRGRHGPNVGRWRSFINPPGRWLWTYSTACNTTACVRAASVKFGFCEDAAHVAVEEPGGELVRYHPTRIESPRCS